MGLLVEGKALSFEETKEFLQYLRKHGVIQFLNTWKRVKDLSEDELRFGDEIEYGIFAVDPETKTVKISIRSAELRKMLNVKEELFAHESEGSTWHPEFGAWMIESTPSRPYTNYASELLRVERNMVMRRRRLLSVLADNEIAPTVTCFPLLGAGSFIDGEISMDAPHSLSIYVPDSIINPHPRFAALTTNIRTRRGKKVDIRVPLFQDKNTPEFTAELMKDGGPKTLPAGMNWETSTDIHMDAMAFGMGMCCLQVTFQARDMDESRYMYDQLAVLAPIMLAVTAASPIFKGRLSDVDARWNIIAQSVDDRTEDELKGDKNTSKDLTPSTAVGDPRMAGGGVKPMPKSRYDSISTYIYHCKGDTACHRTFGVYNDIPCPVDEEVKAQLRAEGVDENLAHHVAHLFSRDHLVAFEGQIEQNDAESTDHFEGVQSTNWQTCRWKPPPFRRNAEDPHIGWRTEFRSMEVQLTDFENAAFTVFIILVTRVVLAFDLGFYIPLSKVDENMRRAQLRDAVQTQLFYFRKHIAPPEEAHPKDSVAEVKGSSGIETESGGCGEKPFPCRGGSGDGLNLSAEDLYEEMTLEEIFTGKGCYFPGLLPLVHAYLDFINCDATTSARVNLYLSFIEKRVTGQLMTPASWMRKFVQSHPAYQGDSVIRPEIAHDLMMACKSIGEGTIQCPELHGDIVIDKVRKEDAYGQVLAGRLTTKAEKSELLRRLTRRGRFNRPDNVARGKWRTPSSIGTDLNLTSMMKGTGEA